MNHRKKMLDRSAIFENKLCDEVLMGKLPHVDMKYND